jgi:cation diffusion facilitator CzcD-associated flavoprotein CzcO
MQYPSLPMSNSSAEFPHHTDILAYLEEFADNNDLGRHISFRVPVTKVDRANGGWDVSVNGRSPRRFEWVVVATGHYWDPAIPELPGEFSGTIIHARDYRAPGRFAGQHVVVVGGAQSALDIVAEISTTAGRTFLACAGVHHLIPRRVLGRPFDDFDTSVALFMPMPLVRLGMWAMMRIGRAIPDRGSLPQPHHRLFETRWPLVVSPALSAAISARAFETRPHLSALDGDRVVFSDGTAEQADAIVFATGYRINFPFLPDHLGLGTGWEFPLYRRILSPHENGLAFVGILEPGPGLFEIVDWQSQWLTEIVAGRLPIPERDRMWEAINTGGERRSRQQFDSTGRHTILCNRHAYVRLLASDLRHRTRRHA